MKKLCSSVFCFYVFLAVYSVLVWACIVVRLLAGHPLGDCAAVTVIWFITCTALHLLWMLRTLWKLNKHLDEKEQEAGGHGHKE